MSSSTSASREGRWSPEPKKASQVLHMVKCLAGGIPEELMAAYEMHEKMMDDAAEFCLYLGVISSNNDLDESLRTRACVLMGQAATAGWAHMAAGKRRVLEHMLLSGVSECPLEAIRRQCASVIAAIVRDSGLLSDWPSLVGELLAKLQSRKVLDSRKSKSTTVSILTCVEYLTRDCGPQVSADKSHILPLIKLLLQTATVCMKSDSSRESSPARSSSSSSAEDEFNVKVLFEISRLSLLCLMHLFACRSHALMAEAPLKRLADTLAALAKCAAKVSSPALATAVVNGVIALTVEHYALLRRFESEIFALMLVSAKAGGNTQNTHLAMCAFDFFNLYTTGIKDKAKEIRSVELYLRELCPLVLQRLVYTTDILATMDLRRDDCRVHREADARDTAARHYSRRRALGTGSVAVDDDSTADSYRPPHGDGGDSDSDEDASDSSSGSAVDGVRNEWTQWNVRKAAARTLDTLVWRKETRRKTLEICIPLIQERLASSEWLVRESALLALSALSSHGFDFLESHLSKIVPLLIEQSSDKHILVATIAVNCLSRFGEWYVNCSDGSALFVDVLKCLCACLRRPSRRVQLSACGTLAKLCVKSCADQMAAHRKALFETFSKCLEDYLSNNYEQLVDVVGTCVQQWAVIDDGALVRDEELLRLVLPPILKRWSALEECSQSIFAIVEALVKMMSCGLGSMPVFQREFAKEVFLLSLNMCVTLKNMCRDFDEAVEEYRTLLERSGEDPPDDWLEKIEVDEPNMSFWVSGLDCLSTVCECTQPSFCSFAFGDAGTRQLLLDVLHCSLVCDHYEVRRNGLALFGDLLSYCPSMIEAETPAFIEECINELRHDSEYVCLNASWCIGVALETFGTKMSKYGPPVLERLSKVMNHSQTPPFLATHTAVTIARLAKVFPAQVADVWPQFAYNWILALAPRPEDSDKESALMTMCTLVKSNSERVLADGNNVLLILETCVSYQKPSDELVTAMRQMVAFMCTALPSWDRLLQSITDPQLVKQIRTKLL